MNGYVIKKGALFVSRPGSEHSYTSSLTQARVYPSRARAEGDATENEVVVSVAVLLEGNRIE